MSPTFVRSSRFAARLVIVIFALVAVGCGEGDSGDEAVRQSGRLVVEKSSVGLPFTEGSVTHLRIVSEDGEEIVNGLRPIDTLDVPLFDREVPQAPVTWLPSSARAPATARESLILPRRHTLRRCPGRGRQARQRSVPRRLQRHPGDDRGPDRRGRQVVTRWSAEGTHSGAFMGIAATGRRVRTTGMEIRLIRDGRIAAEWGESDELGLLTQLGAVECRQGA